ncbi:MAG: hypothetical protein HYU64_08665 [Armatimonadetes bacterium]|nr:hypothetical protein [Armatimonadota bacterium]
MRTALTSHAGYGWPAEAQSWANTATAAASADPSGATAAAPIREPASFGLGTQGNREPAVYPAQGNQDLNSPDWISQIQDPLVQQLTMALWQLTQLLSLLLTSPGASGYQQAPGQADQMWNWLR